MRTTKRIATYAGIGSVLTMQGEVATKYHLDVYQDLPRMGAGSALSSGSRASFMVRT
jgi:hypothetical protein